MCCIHEPFTTCGNRIIVWMKLRREKWDVTYLVVKKKWWQLISFIERHYNKLGKKMNYEKEERNYKTWPKTGVGNSELYKATCWLERKKKKDIQERLSETQRKKEIWRIRMDEKDPGDEIQNTKTLLFCIDTLRLGSFFILCFQSTIIYQIKYNWINAIVNNKFKLSLLLFL